MCVQYVKEPHHTSSSMKNNYVNSLLKVVVIIAIVVIIDHLGVAFLVLKTVSIPFVPNRNIDHMSDYYTAVWKRVKGNSVDNERFEIIDITEYSRRDISEILQKVSKMNPKVIGLDVSFIAEEDSDDDSLLVQTIQSIHNIVLPVEYREMEQGIEDFYYSIFYDQLKDKDYGVVSFPNNRDVIRLFTPSFSVEGQSIDAFGWTLAKRSGANLSDIDCRKEMIINYTTLKLEDDDALPGFQFLNMNQRDSISLTSEIAGKIVLIGGTKHTSDQHLTPLGNSLSGIMIHAHIINSLVENKVIHSTSLIIRYLLCLLIAIVAIIWNDKRRNSKVMRLNIWKTMALWCVLFLASVILFAGVGTFLFCQYYYYIDFSPYIVTIIIAHLLKEKTITIRKS